MAFVIRKVSDYGTSNPIVARLAVQTHEVIRFFEIDTDRQHRVLGSYVNSVKPRLLRCLELADAVTEEANTINERILRNEVATQACGRVVELPQVTALVERVETYLYNAKSALRDLALVFEPLFGERFTHSRYNDILAWAVRAFGADAPLTKFLADDEPWIRRIVDMRNAVEHPSGKQGPLNILNFELIQENAEGRFFQEPVWFFEGEQPALIAADMQTMLNNLLTFAEELLVVCYVQLHPTSVVQFATIPEAKRDPTCPVRLHAVLDRAKLNASDRPDLT